MKKKGFTLTEIIVVIAIIAILVGASIGIGAKQVHNARINETTAFLQTMASNLEEGIMDIGFLHLENPAAEVDDITAFLTEMADIYLSCDIDISTLNTGVISGNYVGFSVQLTLVQDAWEQPFTLYYLTDYPTAKAAGVDEGYYITVASKGPNAIEAASAIYGYHNANANGGVDDDLVVIMESR